MYEKKSGADGDGGYTVPRRTARMVTALRTNYSSASDLAEGLNKASAAVGANATFAAGTGTAPAAAGKEQEEYIDPEDDEDDIFEDYYDPMIKVRVVCVRGCVFETARVSWLLVLCRCACSVTGVVVRLSV